MIPFDFIYCRPASLEEAVQVYTQFQAENKIALYYAGGSEIITQCRAQSIRPDAVIDIKSIAECTSLTNDPSGLHIGAACTLTQIKESRMFPLLGLACGRIADHTNQCRITLCGNLCGTIIYREASLPLLLSDAVLTLYGPDGKREVPFQNIFKGRMLLNPGELVVQVHIPPWALNAKCAHIKKTTNEKIDYPLVNVTAIRKDGFLRIAFSGLCTYPFRSTEIENALNDAALPHNARIEKAIALLPEAAHTDAEGSGAYRVFVLRNILLTLLEDMDHGKI